MLFRIMSGLAAIAMFGSCTTTGLKGPLSKSFGPLKAFSVDSIEMNGVWQSRGYGWIFDIEDGLVSQYQQGDELCFQTPVASKALSETLSLDYKFYRTSDSGDQAILQLLPDDTEIRVQRLEALPATCSESRSGSKQETFDYFAETMAEHYAFFEVRQIDWETRVEQAKTQLDEAMTEAAFFDLMASMLEGFSDSHTKLLAVIDDQPRRQQDGLGTTLTRLRAAEQETPWIIGLFGGLQGDVLDPGSVHTANDRILWGTIDDRIGYIQILVMGGFTDVGIDDPGFREAELGRFDGVMDEALTAMADSEFVILDLSNNRGGYDAISRRLIARFAESDVIAYQTEVPGSGVTARARMASLPSGVRYPGPVLLLTSDVTVSGGELATLGLRYLPNVAHMGGTTRGSFSTVFAKPLPNGWVIELSNEIISGPDGAVFEEIGIAPEIELELFPEADPVAGYFTALDEAIQIMEASLSD